MKIRTQLQLGTIIFILSAIGVISAIVLVTKQNWRDIEKRDRFHQIEKKVYALNLLTDAYLSHPREHLKDQWESVHRSLGALLAKVDTDAPETHDLVEIITSNHKELTSPFFQLVLMTSAGSELPFSLDLKEMLVNRISVQLRMMLDSTERLVQRSQARIAKSQQRLNFFSMLIVLGITATGAFLLLLCHRVLASIVHLGEAAELISQEKWDHRIEVEGNDEVAGLAGTFNHMAARLGNSYAALEAEIAERKRAEEEIREINEILEERVAQRTAELAASENRLKRAQELASLGSWELDRANTCFSFSDEAYRIFGLKPQELAVTYENFLETIHPDDRAAVDAAYAVSIEEGKDTYEIEHRLVRKSNGEVRTVHQKCEHIRDESGLIVRSIGMVHDISERKRMEEALRKARDELEIRVQERTAELRRANEVLRSVPARLIAVQEEERKRLAMEIHDSVAQTLAGLKYGVEFALSAKDMGNPDEVFAHLDGFIPVLQRAIEETRAMYTGLRPKMLEEMGLLRTIRWYTREFVRLYPDHHVELELRVEEREIAEELKIVIFRIAQEALNNVAKHSRAQWVNLSLQKRNNAIELLIRDDGVGIDLAYISSHEATARSLGLRSMRERVEFTAGSFSIESAPGKGTTVRAVWPDSV